MTNAELSEHIHDCGWHMECSYASFQAHGNPADRDTGARNKKLKQARI